MNHTFLFITLIFLSFTGIGQNQLKLKKIVSIDAKTDFELSGICLHPKFGVLAVADNKKDIYKIDTKTWEAKKIIEIVPITRKNKKFDLEGIDVYKNKIYLLEERNSKIFRVKKNGKLKEVKINYEQFNTNNGTKLSPNNWGNAGYEGLAFSRNGKKIFLAKERKAKNVDDKRFILEINRKNGEIIQKFNTDNHLATTDFTDLKHDSHKEENYLYALLRNEYAVAKINTESKQNIKISFKQDLTDEKGMLMLFDSEKPQFGIAEALLITPEEIWIGLDNNNYPINEKHPLALKYHLSGRNPIILIYERPKHF